MKTCNGNLELPPVSARSKTENYEESWSGFYIYGGDQKVLGVT